MTTRNRTTGIAIAVTRRPTLDQSFWISFGGIGAAGVATQDWSKVGPFTNKVKDSLGKKKKGKR